MAGVVIRRAVSSDVAAIERIVAAAFEMYISRIGRKPAPMTADHAAAVASSRVWVIDADGVIAGVVVNEAHDDHLLLDTVAVDPEAQGRGYGALLLTRAEDDARELGLAEVRLYTNEAMTENQTFYPRHGYVEIARPRRWLRQGLLRQKDCCGYGRSSMKHPLDRYAGAWALITGAARVEGLGYAFAREIAGRRINLVLVDILADELEARAAELRSEYGVEVRAVGADLGDLSVYQRITDELADIAVDVLVCDHMFTPKDTPKFLDMSLDVLDSMIDINARAYTQLLRLFLPPMVDRGRGAVVIVSSGSGLVPAPYTGAYAANKAYQIVLGEVLWYETRGTGVDVLVMSAGLMDTQGDALGRYPRWMIADPRDAAAETLRAIGRKHMIMPGWPTRLFTLINTRVLPRRVAVSGMGRFMERGLGK